MLKNLTIMRFNRYVCYGFHNVHYFYLTNCATLLLTFRCNSIVNGIKIFKD